MGLRGYEIPDEVYLLCLLHNIGATAPDRSLTLNEISRWTGMDAGRVEEKLEKLIRNDYVQRIFRDGDERFHVTINGIRKVLSMYS